MSRKRIKLHYSGIQVRSLNRSLNFYKYLGLRIKKQGTMPHGGRWVQLFDPDTDQRLELNWYPKRSKFYERYRNGSELDHIGFIVDDAVKWFSLLLRRGAKPAAKPFGDTNETLAYVKDPDGIWIELIGPGRKR
ncbi:MAG TPA: VOC family protein [Candidatus Bathyarchaeia archaeon]|nr:VOC family protein [Candidatus Bathyarchaeia archaeon]